MAEAWPQLQDRGADIGEAVATALSAESAWVHRRVETIDLLQGELVRRRVSVDFTLTGDETTALRIPDMGVAVPVATLRKAPLRHFDLRDEGGRSVPVLGREDNGFIAFAALMMAVAEARTAGGLSPVPSERISGHLRSIARGSVDDAREALARVAAHPRDLEATLTWQHSTAASLLERLAENYLLVAVLPDCAGRRILKYAYDEVLPGPPPLQLAGFGFSPAFYVLDAPAAGRAGSYHAEVVIPEELRIESAVLYDTDDLGELSADEDADRAAVYTPGLDPRRRPALLVAVRPERSGFLTAATAIAGTTLAMLLGGWVFGDLERIRSGPSVSVLLAGSALFAGHVVRVGESRTVRVILAGPRVLLSVVGITALTVSATVAFVSDTGTVRIAWNVATVLTAIVGVMIVCQYVLASPARRPVETHATGEGQNS